MPPIGRNTKMARFDELTDDQIQARWKSLLPTFIRWLCISTGVMACVFVYNHFFKPAQRITDIANVVFQLASIFSVCFVVLTLAALYFRGDHWKKKATD